MLSKKILTRCPICGGKLKILKVECENCGTIIEGEFDMPVVLSLDKDDYDFLILFLKTRGNLSEVAKILGVSFPTAKTRLNSLLKKMGIDEAFEERGSVKEVIEMLEKGEIKVEDAIKMLKEKT